MNTDPEKNPDTDEAAIQRWVVQARGGDDDAFARIVEAFATRLQGLLYRILLDWEEAQDAAQETFVRAHRALSRYRPEAKFHSWLFQIGARVALDALRRRKRRPEPPQPDDAPSRELGSEDRAVTQHEIATAIESAVASLPAEQRTAFILSEYEGASNAGIAEAMEVSVKSVEMHLYRARQALKENLKRYLD